MKEGGGWAAVRRAAPGASWWLGGGGASRQAPALTPAQPVAAAAVAAAAVPGGRRAAAVAAAAADAKTPQPARGGAVGPTSARLALHTAVVDAPRADAWRAGWPPSPRRRRGTLQHAGRQLAGGVKLTLQGAGVVHLLGDGVGWGGVGWGGQVEGGDGMVDRGQHVAAGWRGLPPMASPQGCAPLAWPSPPSCMHTHTIPSPTPTGSVAMKSASFSLTGSSSHRSCRRTPASSAAVTAAAACSACSTGERGSAPADAVAPAAAAAGSIARSSTAWLQRLCAAAPAVAPAPQRAPVMGSLGTTMTLHLELTLAADFCGSRPGARRAVIPRRNRVVIETCYRCARSGS